MLSTITVGGYQTTPINYTRDLLLRKFLMTRKLICFQETWYSKQDLAALNNLHPEFHGIGQSTVDNTTGLFHGHAPGGVAIMWRSSLEKYVTPLDFNINCIRIQQGNQICVILCVYMPYECRDNEESYLDNLGITKTIIDELDCTCISILGDWNSDISDRTSLFGNHVRMFCTENNLILSSESFLPGGTFTHYSEAWHTTSWLDHCISTSDANEIINNTRCKYFDPCYARATVVRARFLAAAFSDGSYHAHVNGAYLRHVTFCIVRGPPFVHRLAYLSAWAH